MKEKILIVDDEQNIREGLQDLLQLEGYETEVAQSGNVAKKILNEQSIDLILSDLRMSDGSGEILLRHVTQKFPEIPIIMITGEGTIEGAVEAMSQGAYSFLTKPVKNKVLLSFVRKALDIRKKTQKLTLENKNLKAQLNSTRPKSQWGTSPLMKEVRHIIEQVAPTTATVLITGESGVGKEVAVDTIHDLSPRKDKPLIKVHCASFSENLLESELFGHEKGSFTGADKQRIGRFEMAHEGTIFLDEIGEIPLSTQVKLLRVLQEKSFERVGGEKSIDVDVRIIAATNKNLKEQIKLGEFREDLYYRLNVIGLELPSLRDRKEDIALFAQEFLAELKVANNTPKLKISAGALNALQNYNWPGNIRELRNIVEYIVVMTKGDEITVQDLPAEIRGDKDQAAGTYIPIKTPLSQVEKMVIEASLLRNNNNKSKTAEELNIGRKTLHRKLDEYKKQNSDEEIESATK